MTLDVALFLGQDALTNGAIYALLSLGIVLVFTVTRVLYVGIGEFLAFSALTMAAMQDGRELLVGWLLLLLAVVAGAMEINASRRRGRATLFACSVIAYAVAMLWVSKSIAFNHQSQWVQAMATLALLVPIGPLIYRVAFQPIANASSLTLLIVSIAVHVSLISVGLLLFGPEGARTSPFTEEQMQLGNVRIKTQAIWIVAAAIGMIGILYVSFGHTLYGKALRAAAMNRTGAALIGVSPALAGNIAFGLATAIGVICGILVSPVTTLFFDSGFTISLKGFVGAILGGLVNYPLAAAGAILVGFIESYASFWASRYKEIIVFTLIIPVLIWRSLRTLHREEEE